jgi:hypothetical protein
MEGAERDSTQDWLLPESKAPPRFDELELRVDEALAIARSSEAAVNVIGEAALDAAKQARRAAELAESASAVALDASRAVAGAGGQAAGFPAAEVTGSPEIERSGSSDVQAPPTVGATAALDEDEALRRFIERADRVAARLQAV